MGCNCGGKGNRRRSRDDHGHKDKKDRHEANPNDPNNKNNEKESYSLITNSGSELHFNSKLEAEAKNARQGNTGRVIKRS